MSSMQAKIVEYGLLCLPRSKIRGSTLRPRMTVRFGSESLSSSVTQILTNLQKECATPLPVLRHVADSMGNDMRAGLAVEDGGSQLKMILTYVHTFPTGNEKGLFYALDLGGTNFRVLRVLLEGKDQHVIATEAEQFFIPPQLMSATSEELFDFIASSLAKFIAKESGEFKVCQGRERELGFTFSAPVKHTSIDSGILIKWTKGFAVSGTVGRDVVACLYEALDRQGLQIKVSALVNDAVGTLVSAKYWDNDVMVAVILGTGTNACYVERMAAIPKLPYPKSQLGTTIISTEWGEFSTGLPLTEFDKEMDAGSINPGEQIFEKAISGMYLGELVRRVILKMAESSSFLGNSVPNKLRMPSLLRTPQVCAMQQDSSHNLDVVGSILLNEIGVESNREERQIMVEVCDTIVKRGGRLAGAGIVGILEKMEHQQQGLIFGKRTVVAIDGSLYENYPQYRNYFQGAITELLGHKLSKNIVVKLCKDGSGMGAALLAASKSKYKI